MIIMNLAFVHMIYDKLLRVAIDVKIKYDNAYLDAFLFKRSQSDFLSWPIFRNRWQRDES